MYIYIYIFVSKRDVCDEIGTIVIVIAIVTVIVIIISSSSSSSSVSSSNISNNNNNNSIIITIHRGQVRSEIVPHSSGPFLRTHGGFSEMCRSPLARIEKAVRNPMPEIRGRWPLHPRSEQYD